MPTSRDEVTSSQRPLIRITGHQIVPTSSREIFQIARKNTDRLTEHHSILEFCLNKDDRSSTIYFQPFEDHSKSGVVHPLTAATDDGNNAFEPDSLPGENRQW